MQDPGTKSYYKRYSTSLLDVTNLRAIRNTSANRKFANSIVVFASRRRETKREKKKKAGNHHQDDDDNDDDRTRTGVETKELDAVFP